MHSHARHSAARTLLILHPVFLLTGVLHAIGGPLLPSLASTFRLNDSQSGLLFLLYFIGSSIGAILCVERYGRMIAAGFGIVVLCCVAVAMVQWPLLLAAFFFLGIGVGSAMSAVSLFAGSEFPRRSAPVLVFLNLSWSAGALLAPLFAARVLLHHSYRTAYDFLAIAAVLASIVCLAALPDSAQSVRLDAPETRRSNALMIAVFIAAAFLEVGIENTAAAWLPTFVLRVTRLGFAQAAALSTFYWGGFLASRGVASILLLRVGSRAVLQTVLPVALIAAVVLCLARSMLICTIDLLLLGIALAPVYPLIVSESLSGLRQTSDTRWVLAAAGFGGSILPWLTGWLSGRSGDIRTGIITIPVAILVLLALLPLFLKRQQNRPPD